MIKPPAGYTHYGFLHGIPVYVDFSTPDAPGIETRWYIPEFCLDIMEALFGCYVGFMTAIEPDFEPCYAIKLTGIIER